MLSRFKSSQVYAYLRKQKNRYKRSSLKGQKRLSLDEMQKILIEQLKIEEGDNLLIHCGFGFLNPDFTPEELLALLKYIVGEKGTIVMPYYPSGLSIDWLESAQIFDIEKVRCRTGILAEKLACDTTSTISVHPTKAVVAWGKYSKDICAEHMDSRYPFDINSPYYKLAVLKQSKSIGLGVRNCSMFHCAEDIYESDKSYLYSNKIYAGKVKLRDKMITVTTYAHKAKTDLLDSEQFFDKHCPEIITLYKNNLSIFYSIYNKKLLNHCELLFKKGISRRDNI